MKTVKLYSLCILSFFMALFMTSCEGFLEKAPEGKIPEEDVDYADLAKMYQPVSGVYAKIRTSGMHWVIWELTIGHDAEVFLWQNAIFQNIDKFIYDDSFWAIDEIWKQYYNIIKVANGALTSLDNYAKNITSSSDMEKYRAYKGEVLFMRAYAYFRLAQAFRDVTILKDNNQVNLRRSKRDVVYKYALEDLQYGIENMPRIRPNQNEHIGAVTAFSAETLAAKIHLIMGDYDKVEELTDDIIKNGAFSLYDDFYQLFKIPGKLCDEAIFEVQLTDFGNGSGDKIDPDQWFGCQGPINSGNISGWGHCGITEEFRNWAIARGETVRATTSFLKAGETTPSGDAINPRTDPAKPDCWNGKAYTPENQLTPGRTKYGENNNIRILRYADVLLMNAEAKVRNGKNGDEPFNKVRTRAAMPELSNVTVDQILDERRMELCFEWGDRYSDLLRTGKAATELADYNWKPETAYYPLPFAQYTTISDLLLDPLEE